LAQPELSGDHSYPRLGSISDEVRLNVRSVSAEGLIKQHGAVKAFDRFIADLGQDATVTVDSVSTSMQGRGGAAPADARLRVAIAFSVLSLWVASVLIRVFSGSSLGWLAGALFLVGLVLSLAGMLLARRSRSRSERSA